MTFLRRLLLGLAPLALLAACQPSGGTAVGFAFDIASEKTIRVGYFLISENVRQA